MVFTKVIKTPAYYSRFQVKYRRRREGRTDYQARRNMIRQELCKYNTPKYRFVVRFTNRKVICQIVYATVCGDKVIACADSTELARYGMPVGLTNYAAAYATGLLCARRVLQSLKLNEVCVGQTQADGKEYHIEDEDTERSAFKCVLDIGLVRTTTGNRVFGALKGAVDGGLYIPHSCKRFPGYSRGENGADDSYDAEVHRKRIFGVHVAEYMKMVQEEDPEEFASKFAAYVKAGIQADQIEELYKKVHDGIRANPERPKTEKKSFPKTVREGNYLKTVGKDGSEVKYWRPLKLTKEQRASRVQAKLAEIARVAAAALEEE
ncbi:60S ribosomal protein L5 [Gregarina niphandrodes]|uniref:60S ribosomal protein L5 n=1 Tax=Gregarina niphandrodes TaxID=110365 RepID=A0A023B1A6_GRENI|nr:60S ribosomal protein L5 [Gregarina niphandrodes]EZG46249.1 60S ribosomal protein L5 [Gregarina niphandrodes]|eukprot:XP_011132319.1 60S ribosomal protein L5 [Gregarina niphandrodes]